MMGNAIVYLFKVLWATVLISLAFSLIQVCAYELPDSPAQRLEEQRKAKELNDFPIRGYDRNVPEPKRIKGYEAESYQQTPYPIPYKSKAY